MKPSKANPDDENKIHSKIDLEDLNSWLPPEVERSLTRMIASRNRKQLEGGAGASSRETDMDALAADRDGPPEPDGGGGPSFGPEFPGPGTVESPEARPPEGPVLSDYGQVDDETVDDGGEVDDSSGGSGWFY